MTDQDRNVDGVAGGTADAGGGHAEGAGGGSETASPTNVVPFPGNWFGSVDELVPITPDAEPQGRVPGAVPAPGPVPAAGPQISSPDLETRDASAFWDGDAPSVEAILPTPGELDGTAVGVQKDWFAAAPVATAAKELEPPEAEEPVVPGQGADGSRRPNIRVIRLAVLMCALAAGCAAVLTQTTFLGHGRRVTGHATAAQSRRHAPVLTQTVTHPVTVTRTVPARDHRGSRAGVGKHRPPSRSVGRRTLAGTRGNAAATSQNSAGSLSSAGTGSSSGAGTSSSGEHSSTPASTSHVSAGSHRGCVESPDSGCLP